MSFMQLEMTEKMRGWRVDTTHGIELIPGDVEGVPVWLKLGVEVPVGEMPEIDRVLQQYCEGEIQSVEGVEGYFGRYSAPGYMDCTPWSFDTNGRRLQQELREMYGEEEME